jgi:5-methylcytosine-specific restriction endonuclease McrA
MARPQTDNYPDELERVVKALLEERRKAAEQLMAQIAYPRREVPQRTDPSETIVASVYRRDRFHCRYCGCQVIPTQIMRLISELFAEEFPYHPNWKGGETHPAIPSRSATLDHVQPWSAGGGNDTDNLVCACWICNRVKGDLTLEQLGWTLLSIKANTQWDGLTRYYRALWELAGKPKSADHQLWMRLFDPEPAEAEPLARDGRVSTLAEFRKALASGTGLVITDTANGAIFHADPSAWTHVVG